MKGWVDIEIKVDDEYAEIEGDEKNAKLGIKKDRENDSNNTEKGWDSDESDDEAEDKEVWKAKSRESGRRRQ